MPQHRHLLVALLILLGVASLVLWRVRTNRSASGVSGESPEIERMAAQLGDLETQEKKIDETVWAKERLAQRCADVMNELWDQINGATNKLQVAQSVPLQELIVSELGTPVTISAGIHVRHPAGTRRPMTSEQWHSFLAETIQAGWTLNQVEFRHLAFDVTTDGKPDRSRFYFSAHLIEGQQRAALEGDLVVHWTSNHPTGDHEDHASFKPIPQSIDASGISLKTYLGSPLFELVFSQRIAPPPKSYFIDPLILHDLDRDGSLEIILLASNLIFRQRPGLSFQSEPLVPGGLGPTFCGAIADFNRDGNPDLLCATFDGLLLFAGSTAGRFDQPARRVWKANPRLKYGQVITAGDIDQDGDLDVWLAQYKVPYERGQMPTPYFDANDGHPSFLLLNDGDAHFSDATTASGLAAKRFRRTYSASFADLDSDHDLDLIVVSDFAGLDLFENTGHGQFRETTQAWLENPRAFGMAHALADFNRDGLIDLLMIGMNSPTVDRLNHGRLTRPGFAHLDAQRSAMTYGNRLYTQSAAPPRFQQTPLNDSIARSGWSWGCSTADLDNDTFPDVYVANGHETGPSVRDHESEFWLHDIYVANSDENVVNTAFFSAQFGRTRGQGFSFGGYEKNRLYLNLAGREFIELAHLAGLALEQDSRNVVADDLDNDGRLDLLVTTFETWPEVKQTLQIFRNAWPEPGNWIGLMFNDSLNTPPVVGTKVVLKTANWSTTRHLVLGDSYRAQHSFRLHFGLGTESAVEQITIHWPGGTVRTLSHPAINRYHAIKAEAGSL